MEPHNYSLGPYFTLTHKNKYFIFAGELRAGSQSQNSFPPHHTHKQTVRVWPWRWHGLLNGKKPMFLSSKPVGHSWNGKLIDHPYTAFLLLEFSPTHTNTKTYTSTMQSIRHVLTPNPSFSSQCVYVLQTYHTLTLLFALFSIVIHKPNVMRYESSRYIITVLRDRDPNKHTPRSTAHLNGSYYLSLVWFRSQTV